MIQSKELTTAQKRGLQPGSIVLVEDNTDDFLVARHHIRKLKVTNPIQRISEPQELLDYISPRGPSAARAEVPVPAMFIIDLRLPGASGLDVQAAIRSNLKFREVPIIVISSPEQLTALRAAVRLGATAYMTKPFNGIEFVRVLLKNEVTLDIADEL